MYKKKTKHYAHIQLFIVNLHNNEKETGLPAWLHPLFPSLPDHLLWQTTSSDSSNSASDTTDVP